MQQFLTHQEALAFLIQISVMLITARILGELFTRFSQPAVIGEMLGGLLLGPSILGAVLPDVHQSIFNAHPRAYLASDGMANVGVIFLLFVAGMEVNLSVLRRQGGRALYISLLGMLLPFLVGMASAWFSFDTFGIPPEHELTFMLFFGLALSVTALSVISKILIDMQLLRTDIGGVIIASTMINDLLGWLIFSIILGLLYSEGGSVLGTLASTTFITLLYTLLLLSAGRVIIGRLLPLVRKYFAWPGGVITFAMCLCFLSAVFTEYLGIHAIFGAFLMGIAFGDSVHFSERSREIIHQFVTNIFAPLFFVSLGLKVDFFTYFDLEITLLVLLFAFIAKFAGSGLGSLLGGLNKWEATAVGFGMNARGAMEAILGALALEAGIINNQLFVAIIIMAIVTSLVSGPLMRYFLRRDPRYRKSDKQQNDETASADNSPGEQEENYPIQPS